MPEWIFDALPPSGARRGGDPAEHAFPRNFDAFVREVVQNANDQRIGTHAPEVRFQFREMAGADLDAFRAKLAWPTLEPHLRAAAKARGGRALDRFLADLDRTRRLLLLTIEDRHTVGLTGGENDEESHFRALCKDTLYSNKRAAGAGGSYGLGKSVLWAFSGLSTVVFNSVLHETPGNRKSPRLIGRVELPSHKTADGWFTGSGWFGQPVDKGGLHAESVWSLNAALEARDLFLSREERATGTSILIVGFRDPAGEDEPDVAALDTRIRDAAARWFWPAMEMNAPGLQIHAGDHLVAPEAVAELRPFVECWRGRASRRAALEQAGDVVVRPIPVQLPAHRDGGAPISGEVLLVVRLAPEGQRAELTGHVALFRGPGMVVKYWDRGSLAHGMRPFHALVAAGRARDPLAVTEADERIEQFLRDAEPPGHDEWHSTPALKDSWKPGYAKALEQLKERIAKELRELLAPRPAHGTQGPERLQKRFPIGKRGAPTKEPSAFHFASLDATFDGVRWHVAGTVKPVRRTQRAWQAWISLSELGDAGSPLDEIELVSAEVTAAGASADVDGGKVQIVAPAGTEAVSFRGTSAALVTRAASVGEVALHVTGRMSSEDA